MGILAPQDQWITQDNRVFQPTAASALASNGGRHIYIGQGGWKTGAMNSLDQIGIAKQAGAPGVVVYNYALCSEPQPGDSISLMDALKLGPFSQPDTVPALAWK
jgi:hypothetical protein